MTNRWNTWLLIGTIVSLVLHFWPLAYWSGTTLVILRIIPALCAQALLYRIGKHAMIKVLPLIITGALAVWGSYIYFKPPHSPYATVWMLFWDYMSPFVSCVIVYGIFKLREKIQ